MSQKERLFTVEEANALLPELTDCLEQMQGATQVMRHLQEQEPPADLPPMLRGDRQVHPAYFQAMTVLQEAFQQVTALGVFVKDLDQGLVDFLSLRQDRKVFLCWRLGEDQVGYWHDLETGFAGRQPIDDEAAPDPGAGEEAS